jgi:VanZ family protein
VLRQSHGLRVLFPYLPTLGLGALALGVVALLILLHTRHSKERQLVIGLSIALAAGILITFTLSYIAHFRLLGRHLSAFFPLFSILLLTGLLPDDNQRRNKFALGALLLLGVAWSVSDFRLRLFLSYEKDDYRDAAALAHNALVRGEPVLWRASGETANYYGLRTTEDTQTGSTARLGAMASVSGDCSLKWFEQSLKDHGEVLVVMSDKSDLFDQGGVCRKTLDSLSIEHVAIFPSFDVWQVTGVKSSLVSF